MRKQDSKLERLVRGAGGCPRGTCSRRGRISKPWVLTAFFGYFPPLMAESTPRSAKQGCDAGVLRMSLLRRTKFPRCLTADTPNFDRGHWLRPTVVPADSRPLSWPPIGALPRNRLAYSAAGSASAISPLHPPPAALGSLPTGAERPRNDKLFTRGAAQNRAGTQCGQQSKTVRVIIKIVRTVNQPDHQMVFSK